MRASSNAERQALRRERMRAQGYRQRTLWAHPDDWPALAKLADELRRKREER